MTPFEHGGRVYDCNGRQRDVLDFSANINPLGMPPTVRAALIKNIDGLIHYPDPDARMLKAAIADRYSLNVENIAVFNGAAEFFYIYFRLMAPTKIYIPAPTFSEYERAAMAAGLEINFETPVENVIICNPNNPTGGLTSIDEIMAQTAAHNVIVDESFIDFVGDGRSVKKFVADNKNLIVVQSLTKIFAIPGLRLGFAVADKNIIERLDRSKDVWNVNYLAQIAGVAALNDRDYIERTRRWIEIERPYVFNRLREIAGIEKVFEPTANFVLMKFSTEGAAREVIARLAAENILVRNCDNFRGLDGRYIRMAIRLRAENDRVLDIIGSTNGRGN